MALLITVALGHPIRLAPRHALCEQAEALAVKLAALWTAAELRANDRLIDQILSRDLKCSPR